LHQQAEVLGGSFVCRILYKSIEWAWIANILHSRHFFYPFGIFAPERLNIGVKSKFCPNLNEVITIRKLLTPYMNNSSHFIKFVIFANTSIGLSTAPFSANFEFLPPFYKGSRNL